MVTKIKYSYVVFAAAIISLSIAVYLGYQSKSKDAESVLDGKLNDATSFSQVQSSKSPVSFLYEAENIDGQLVGYVSVSEGEGYGGPITVVVGWSCSGVIKSITITDHSEDNTWFDRLYQGGFFEQYIGRQFDSMLSVDTDIDAITGATISSKGVAGGVQAGRALLAVELDRSFPIQVQTSAVSISLKEIVVMFGLVGVVLIRFFPILRSFTWIRYISLMFGFGVLGVWLVSPLSLTNIARWIMGTPPSFATGLLLNILVIGVIGPAIIFGKNFYCYWLCPFSAVQETTYRIGRGGIKASLKWHKKLQYTRYLILWAVLLVSFMRLNPSLSIFEPWGTLFSQHGTYEQWLLLIFVIVFSFFVSNIWCYYTCPIGAFMDIAIRIRREVIGLCKNLVLKKRHS